MTVIETEDGFVVVDGSCVAAGPFETNAQAWRVVDRLEGSPVSAAEKRADWISTKILSKGPAAPRHPWGLPKKEKRQDKKMKRAAAQAPAWVRDIAAANFDPHGVRLHQDWKLGTFGAASPVRSIPIADYLAEKNGVPHDK